MRSPRESTFGAPPTADEDRLLDEALALPPEARRQWMLRLERDAPLLAARIGPVLAEAETGDAFLPPGGALGGVLAGDLLGELRQELHDDPDHKPLLPPGRAIGPYEILERVGAGGMGEVYRARDTKLRREVAIKVLPAHLERRGERVARLRREAQLLAALNHPNIATIHELEELDDITALVLEMVDGQTLAERLYSGPVPADEAVGVARQLVDALEAAHARGVIHRDLKPGNIKLTTSGRIKVLDFGIATVLRDEHGASLSPELWPTTTVGPAGAVFGTAAYMSPEQVRGKAVDNRADIWAFGCVLYEMLAGRRAFTGDTPAEVMARVLERAPALDWLPDDTPASLRQLIERCLQKDPTRRLAPISGARAYLDAAVTGRPIAETPTSRLATVQPSRRRNAVPAVLGLLLGAAVSGLVMWTVMRPPPQPVTRLTVPVPSADELVTGELPAVALSPDGTTIVYRARHEGVLQLFARSLGESAPRAISGSADAMAPFFSPDSAWIGFDLDGVLMKVSAAGGSPVKICDTGAGGSASSWSESGDIVFGATTSRGLRRVSGDGGTPVALTEPDTARGEVAHILPEVLPGGRAAVFTIEGKTTTTIAAVRFDTGAVKRLTEGRQARYASSGHLLVVRGNALFAAPFDLASLTLKAEPIPVLRRLDQNETAHFALARNGSLVYVPARDLTPPRHIVWIDRKGREVPSGIEKRRFERLNLSPDGSKVALVISDDGGQDLWVYDFSRQTLTRLTFDPHGDTAPIWTPDGRTIVFRSDRDGGGLFRMSADGTGPRERLTRPTGALHTPYAFTPDARQLLYAEFRSYRDQGIGLLDLDGARRERMIVDGPFAELRPALSPDGRWLAYQSDESGEFEIYLRPFPDVGAGRWQVSTAGGRSPQWGPAGRELLYFESDTLMRVPVSGSVPPLAGAPERLFSAALFGERLGPLYSVSPDGSRILAIRDDSQRDSVAARRQLLLVQNWVSELGAQLARRR